MKTIQEFKKRYKLQNKDLASLFGYKRTNSYEHSSQKERFENATIDLVNMIDTDRVECFKKYLLEYKKACAALKTLNIDENDFIDYLKENTITRYENTRKNKLKELLEKALDNFDIKDEVALEIAQAFHIELTEEKFLDVYVKIPLAEAEIFDTDKLKVTATYKGKEIEVKA